jgi:SAM-dependent MidA family methyltransferase
VEIPQQPWREAMTAALYGEAGFFSRGPGSTQFRTSANSSALFAGAMLRLALAVDEALGRPDPFDVVDVGAGGGELLGWLTGQAPTGLRERLRPRVVELAPRRPGVPAPIAWSASIGGGLTGVLLATEWLDNVPLEVAAWAGALSTGGYSTGAFSTGAGPLTYVLVDPETGDEAAGGPLSRDDAAWAERWWPPTAGARIELGGPRDEAWAAAVGSVHRGLAVTVDYGHTRDARPPFGTLTGYAGGRQLPPVPDGSMDITAHVAIDAARSAGEAVAGAPAVLTTQRAALRGLGVTGGRPARELSTRDPAGYVRALATAGQAAELTDPAGLGGHHWLLQPVGVRLPVLAGMAP